MDMPERREWLASDNYLIKGMRGEGNCCSADDYNDPSYLWYVDKYAILGDYNYDNDDVDDDDHKDDVLA